VMLWESATNICASDIILANSTYTSAYEELEANVSARAITLPNSRDITQPASAGFC
jgi:hypothetical protein